MQERKKEARLLMPFILLSLIAFGAPIAWSHQPDEVNSARDQSGRRKNRGTENVESAGSHVRIRRAPLKSDLEEFPLPGAVSRSCVGAGGRFIFLLIPDVKKLAVFDVEKLKITKYVTVTQEDVHIAAGIDKLFIAYPDQGKLERYELSTFRKEVTAKLPVDGQIGAMLMGSASTGPLYLCGTDGMRALDPIALTEHALKWLSQNGESSDRSPFAFQNDTPQLQISGNGRVIVNSGRGGVSIYRRQGNHTFLGVEAKNQSGRIQNGIPSPDGRIIYGDGQMFNSAGVPVGKRGREVNPGWLVPSVENAFYVALLQLGNRNNMLELGLAIGVQGEDQSVMKVKDPRGLEGLVSYPSGETARFEQHLFFVPDANVLAILPLSKDRLFLHRIDIEKQLNDAGIDYLIVISQPPTEIVPGKEWKYQIEARAKKGKVEFVLEAAPDGMTLSEDGLVEWHVPLDLEDDEVNVIITLRDSTGQQIFHNLQLEKSEPENAPAPQG